MSSELLPPNSTAFERAAADAFAQAMETAVPIRDLWRPETCPEAFLPYLAWAFSVDTWDANWPTTFKRQVIAESLSVHRIKGTPASIKRALAALGLGDATLAEGFDAPRHDGAISYDGGEDYGTPAHWATYRVFMTRPISNEQADQVRALLAELQPARCKLTELNYLEAAQLYDGAQTFGGAYNHGVA